MSTPATPILPPFDPVQLGRVIRNAEKEGLRNFVTFLVGAGFSKSAGIPLASEIVKDLRAEGHPFLDDVGQPPDGTSEYAFLMEKLGSPKERANRVKKYVDLALDAQKRLKINWSHLLLATLVEKGYVHRLLTTNFDPLIVEALAVTGQPIRTYDLNTTGKYSPGTLDPATVIYLHGQMHSLFLVNSPDEMERLRSIYPKALQEAVQNSFLIVLGYSGDCDPVLDSLAELPNFPRGLWWCHYNPAGDGPGTGVHKVFARHGTDCHLATGDDSDTFMRKLVLDGMKLDLPDEVLKPITAIRLAIERITPFPNRDIQAADPVKGALEMLRRAEELAEAPAPPRPVAAEHETKTKPEELDELAGVVPIEMAALAGNWTEFNRLRAAITANPKSILSTAIGDGLVHQASAVVEKSDFAAALEMLDEAKSFGVTMKMAPWLPTVWGNALSGQAKLNGSTPAADTLFSEAAAKYAEALRLKPDMHEAFYNWGNALFDQATLKGYTPAAATLFAEAATKYAQAIRIKPDKHWAFNNWGNALEQQAKVQGNTPETDALFAEAATKYAEALRLKPDLPEAFNNWGTALLDQAKLKGNTPQADALLAEAATKYAEALRIKPDKFDTHFNLACLAALQLDSPRAVESLKAWARYHPAPTRQELDQESDFGSIRADADFIDFRNTLPG
jgi:tetratricopeptide (TPR) repeat protein